jgi:hypothetical protein
MTPFTAAHVRDILRKIERQCSDSISGNSIEMQIGLTYARDMAREAIKIADREPA